MLQQRLFWEENVPYIGSLLGRVYNVSTITLYRAVYHNLLLILAFKEQKKIR